jgi:raffinose/stachyose/melibiose transport system permease protein
MKPRKWSTALQWVIIVVMIFVCLFPLYLVLINAFKPHAEIVKNPVAMPVALFFDNFVTAWKTGEFGTGFINSVRLVVVTTAIVLLAAVPAGYVLGMKKFRGNKVILIYLMMATTVPVQLFLFPMYSTLSKLGLVGNLYAVCFIIAAMNLPLSIMLMRTFFLRIPTQIEEAARIDGASTMQSLLYIIVPMVRPGLITVSVLVVLNAWNEYLISSTFLQGNENFTVILDYLSLNGGSVTFDQGMKMAGAVMIIVPILIFFLSLQKYFVDGMTNGAVKE